MTPKYGKRSILKYRTKIKDCKDIETCTYEEFLKNIVHMSEADYIKCIRASLIAPKIFLQRKPSEVGVNPYMTPLLDVWKANHDLQFVLDPYACAVYIFAYISKSQRGMSVLLDEACKEARRGNMDIKRAVRHMGNKFLNSVEVCAQETAYLVLQLPLTKSSRDVVFINTSQQAEWTFLLKQKEALEELPANSTDIETDNIIKRYSKRPKVLEQMCLADYVSQLEFFFPKRTKKPPEINDDDLAISESEDDDDNSDLSGHWTKIKMKNGLVIKRRKVQKVIRYVRYNVKTDSEHHYRE